MPGILRGGGPRRYVVVEEEEEGAKGRRPVPAKTTGVGAFSVFKNYASFGSVINKN